MSEDKEKGRVEVSRIFLIEFQLAFEIILRVVECMDFVHPERFLIKRVEPQEKADEQAKRKDKKFFSSWAI
jgi:hypothetical protein